MGRFASPDTLVPDPSNPQSFNRYSYTNNNPVNFTDPSGHCAGSYDVSSGQATEDQACWDYLYNEFCGGGAIAICSNWTERLHYFLWCFNSSCSIDFGLGYWTKGELSVLRDALAAATTALNGAGLDGVSILKGIGYRRIHSGNDSYAFPANTVNLRSVNEQTIWHETGHAISFKNGHKPQNEFFNFAESFVSAGYYNLPEFCYRTYCSRNYGVLSSYTGQNPEYWADGFAVWVQQEANGMPPVGWYGAPPNVSWDLLVRAAAWSLQVSFGN